MELYPAAGAALILAAATAAASSPSTILRDLLGPVWGPLAAAATALLGGAPLLRYIDNRYSSRLKKADIEIKLHDEARDEIRELKARLDKMDETLRQKDRVYSRTLIKYNILRERYHLPLDMDDPELESHISKMLEKLPETETETKPSGSPKKPPRSPRDTA